MIAKLIKGKGFRGAVEYDLQPHKSLLLETNMAGNNPRELAKEFGEVRKLRPNLSKAVCHVSLSIHPTEALSDNQWCKAAQAWLSGMEFTDNQYIISRHTDAEHPHIHILVNRITLDGNVISDAHDYKRQEVIMRELEHSFGLCSVQSSQDVMRKTLSKGEVEQAVRTNELPCKMQLQQTIDEVLQEHLTLNEFIVKLKKANIEVKLNQSSTGTISGISFSKDNIAFKGSSLGKGYSWKALQKRGLSYEQAESNQRTCPTESNGYPDVRGSRVNSAIGSACKAARAELEEFHRSLARTAQADRDNSIGQPEHAQSCARSQKLSR